MDGEFIRMINKEMRLRMRKQYIKIAKKILINEGAKAVTARRLGKEMDYSYATVYNYFDSIENLLWHVAISFGDDYIKQFQDYNSDKDYNVEDLVTLFMRYIEYHFKNPNIFKFYLNPMQSKPSNEIINSIKAIEVNEIVLKVITSIMHENEPSNKSKMMTHIITSSVYGMLTLHFGNIMVLTQDQIRELVKQEILFILEEYKQ
ncbi:TetR/AcrR family transcriptional regulator [Clostridiaceae bacterium M8S5]|nr:TetR/AcrR family transcriptional regulator [Clostridiaceae bacterium M8S5]